MKRTARFGTRLMRRPPQGLLRIVVSVVLGGGAAGAQEAAAQDDCAEVIRMSRHTASVVQTQDHFEEHATNFCDAYRSSQSSSRSRTYQASYKLLAGSMSGSRTSESQVASKYCSANKRESRRQDAYKQYLNTVSPGAFSAYATCKQFSSTGTQIALSAVHEREMFVNLTNSLDTGEARINYRGTQGIDCLWDASDDNEQSQEWVLEPRSAAVVKCNRTSPTQKDSVIVYTSTSPKTPLTFPWSAYNEEGHPVDSLRDLQQQLATLGRDVTNLSDENENLSNAVQGYMNRQWCDVTTRRHSGQDYRNEYGYPIEVAVSDHEGPTTQNSFCVAEILVDDRIVSKDADTQNGWGKWCFVSATVPPGSSYKIQGYTEQRTPSHWSELMTETDCSQLE